MRWNGSVALITGASRGIGEAVARAAVARGARVGLIARSKDDLERVLAGCGGKGAIAVADAAERTEVEGAIAALERELGPADILVNNAGIGAYGFLWDTELDTHERMIRVNYLGLVYATRAVLPGMIARGRGHIVNISSIAGRLGAPLEAGYSATKFAVSGLSEALALELAPRGVRVSTVNPGPVETHFFEARGAPYKRSFPRPVSAERVAGAVIKAVEKNLPEQYVPRWLRFPVILKAIAPPLYRKGTARDFRNDLRS